MLRPVMTGMLITMERRGLIELVSEVTRNRWKVLQLRGLVVFSITLQVILMLLGKLRKHNGKPYLRFAVWCAYLLSDWVATIALGVISNKVQEYTKQHAPLGVDLISFWAPFLLLHLGGPDTITAYSLEDNQLWRRRLLELVTQFVVVLYIFLMAWPGISFLSLLTIPMMLAGLIKFGERIYSLRSASTEQFRFSQMTEPDPGPNYSKFMEEFTLKKAEGFFMKAEEIETPLPTCGSSPLENEELILKAYGLFQTFKRLFVDLILSFQIRDESQCFFHQLDYEKAFEVIEIELGFAYDVFYTKAPVVCNRWGHIRRFISFSATLSSLVVFISRSRKDHYHAVELNITYALLVVALILEFWSHLTLLFSDWPSYWMKKLSKKISFSCFRYFIWARRKRWSNSIAQYSIHNFCEEHKSSRFPRFLKFLMAENKVDELFYLTYSTVSPELKELIFNYFLKISKSGDKSQFTALCTSRGKRGEKIQFTALCTSRGKRVLEDSHCSHLIWSITEADFDQSILLWHIATELCYHLDEGQTENDVNTCQSTANTRQRKPLSEYSKHLSEYMMYLLALCPFMLPMGIGMIRFRDTCAEAQEFFNERRDLHQPDKAEACKMLLRVNTEILPGKVKGDRSKSVLFDACRLATELRSKDLKVDKWKIISEVWVEILAYAACHCRGTHHAQQLRKGGEFLTHIWLLMAHLGLTEQFQISQGHARVKLSAK